MRWLVFCSMFVSFCGFASDDAVFDSVLRAYESFSSGIPGLPGNSSEYSYQKYADVAASDDTVIAISHCSASSVSCRRYYLSHDGRSWEEHSLPVEGGNRIYRFDDTFYVTSLQGNILSSTDGLDWQVYATPATKGIASIAYGAGRFVASAYVDEMFVSENGLLWSRRADLPHLLDLLYGNGVFLGLTRDGLLYSSEDGLSWSPQEGLDGANLAHAGGLLFLLGKTGQVFISSDGVSWNKVATFFEKATSVTFRDGHFVLVGERGLLASSSDGVSWSLQFSGTDSAFSRVIAYDGQLLAAGQSLYSNFTLLGRQAPPTVVHLVEPGNGFVSRVVLANTSANEVAFRLVPYDADGVGLASVTGSVEAGATLTEAAIDLLPAGAAWFELDSADGLMVWATYEAASGEGSSISIAPSQVRAPTWWLLPANDGEAWDGIAVVNTASSSVVLTLSLVSADGTVLDDAVFVTELAPGAKVRFGVDQPAQTGSRYRLDATRPVAAIALRGNQEFFWQNELQPQF